MLPLSENVRSSEEAELSVVPGECACTSGLFAKWTCLRPWSCLKLMTSVCVERMFVVLGGEHEGVRAGLYVWRLHGAPARNQTALATSRRPVAVPRRSQRRLTHPHITSRTNLDRKT